MPLSTFAKPLSFPPGVAYFSGIENHLRRFQSAAIEAISRRENERNAIMLSKLRVDLNTQVQACVKLLRCVRLADEAQIKSLLLNMFGSLGSASSRNSLVHEVKRGDGPFYRIRSDKGGVDAIHQKQPKAVFHVPIQLQHNVRQTRYSSDGVTSLYLATTIATAVKECGDIKYLLPKQRAKGGVEYCNLAAFYARREMMLLDLSLRSNLDREVADEEELLAWLGDLLTLPLRLLCHTTFKKKGEESKKKDGYQLYYVIPNAIAKLVMQQEIVSFSTSATPLVGIQFSSVRTYGQHEGMNCVLFPSYPNLQEDEDWSEGHCKTLEDLILGSVRQVSARELGRLPNLSSATVASAHYGAIEAALFRKAPLKPKGVTIGK